MVDPELLIEIPMFQALPLSERQRLAALMREEFFPSGRVIFELGDPGSAMYIVRRGRVRISVPGDSGEEVRLADLGPGEFFGEVALLDENPRSARATTIEETVLYSLGRDNFLAFVASRPDTALSMLSATAKRLRQTDELMRSRASFDVNAEFARHETQGGRWADLIAMHAGSWTFIAIFAVFVTGWIILNHFVLPRFGVRPFDTDEWQVLALVLGIIASFQAPIIMMSQNRDGLRDRIRADADFKVNLKNEVAIEKALDRVEEVRRQIPDLRRQLKEHEAEVQRQYEQLAAEMRSHLAGAYFPPPDAPQYEAQAHEEAYGADAAEGQPEPGEALDATAELEQGRDEATHAAGDAGVEGIAGLDGDATPRPSPGPVPAALEDPGASSSRITKREMRAHARRDESSDGAAKADEPVDGARLADALRAFREGGAAVGG